MTSFLFLTAYSEASMHSFLRSFGDGRHSETAVLYVSIGLSAGKVLRFLEIKSMKAAR